MNDELKEFIDNLTYWLKHSYEITATIASSDKDTCELDLTDEEGQELYIGSFADPGLFIRWIGEVNTGLTFKTNLVLANSIPIAALGKHVAGWAVGLQ